MTNHEFWSSITQIIDNHFSSTDTRQLEQYAQQFIAGRLLFTRYTDNEQFGCAAGGTIHVIASILAGAETPADQLTASEGSFKREQQRAQAQAAVIEQWARTVGCWTDNVDEEYEKLFGEQLAEGGEAHVYDNGNTIVKRIGLDYYILPALALDRISLHNALFPSTKMVVLGFGRTAEGEFQILVQQNFIFGSRLTDSEIQTFAESMGFQLINPRNWTYATPSIYLSDLHDENVLLSPQGNIFVIDCDIRINTPELRCGGTRALSNEIYCPNIV